MSTVSVSPADLVKQWDELLSEYARLDSETRDPDKKSFEKLLTDFATVVREADTRQAAESKQDEEDFKGLLDGYAEAFKLWREQQVALADDFNLVELLGLTSDENRHSDVLAWLLNSDIYQATHSQGNLGFKVFLRELGLPGDYADCDYRVGREVQGAESRIDIELFAPGKFIIGIEAKIGAGEGEDQTPREWRDLRRKACRSNVPHANIHAFYLTPGGEKPSDPDSKFTPISWGLIAQVFEEFGKQAKADSVRWFARHYADALRKFIVQQPEKENSDA